MAPSATFQDLPQSTSGYIIAVTVVLLVASFSALVCFAYRIRRRRDKHYAQNSAIRYATSIHLRDRIPVLGQVVAFLGPPLGKARASVSSVVPESWRAFAAEWLHDSHDDDGVRDSRRNNDNLAMMSRSLQRGHPASASAPDLIHRGEETRVMTMHEHIREASIPSRAPEPTTGVEAFMPRPSAREYKSVPNSIFGGERLRLGDIPEETIRVLSAEESDWKAEQLERISTKPPGMPEP